MLPLIDIAIWFTVACYGLVLGSFATALIYRVPRNISWIKNHNGENDEGKAARSACTSCGHVLGIIDLFPVFSWLITKGKCRYCGAPISSVYPMAELLCMIGALGVFAIYGLSLHSVIFMLCLPFLVALFFIDIQTFRLPNQLVFIIGVLAVFDISASYIEAIWNGLDTESLHSYTISRIVAAFIYSGLLWLSGFMVSKILKRPSLGLGDVKFYAVAGLWLGVLYLPDFMMLCGLLGLIWGFWYKRTFGGERFPFGPALILAFYGGMLLQGAQLYFLSYNI